MKYVDRLWTENKDNTVLFLRQLGEWYVTDKCIGKPIADILGIGDLVLPCCATEPIFSCHYRDKPSKLPCKSSGTIDPGGGSFWYYFPTRGIDSSWDNIHVTLILSDSQMVSWFLRLHFPQLIWIILIQICDVLISMPTLISRYHFPGHNTIIIPTAS